jgi:hypothetical protein
MKSGTARYMPGRRFVWFERPWSAAITHATEGVLDSSVLPGHLQGTSHLFGRVTRANGAFAPVDASRSLRSMK